MTLGLAVIIVSSAVVHAVFLWRGVPRPLVQITSTGVTARGFFGMAHVAWEAFAPEYAIVPDRRLRLGLPVYTRLAVQRRGLRRGLRPYGVRLPPSQEPSYDPFSLSAAWATNPWWAGQALAVYYRSPRLRSQIGTRAEHDRLGQRKEGVQGSPRLCTHGTIGAGHGRAHRRMSHRGGVVSTEVDHPDLRSVV